MKTEQKMFAAFVLNLAFSLLEFAGGVLTGSVAIVSDAVHDLGDAVGIGVACLLEKKSRRPPDSIYTYGYAGYSLLGSCLVTLILLGGSAAVLLHAAQRLACPIAPDYDGMLLFAVIGLLVNGAALLLTRRGSSHNQQAVSLHMLEDVLGWGVVLVGAVVMRFTGFALLDPLLSMAVALFIAVHAGKNLWAVLGLLLAKAPRGLDAATLKAQLTAVDGVADVHHLHIWSMDGQQCCATLHAVVTGDPCRVKADLRHTLLHLGVQHATLELEAVGEPCTEEHCHLHAAAAQHGHHHHGHCHGC